MTVKFCPFHQRATSPHPPRLQHVSISRTGQTEVIGGASQEVWSSGRSTQHSQQPANGSCTLTPSPPHTPHLLPLSCFSIISSFSNSSSPLPIASPHSFSSRPAPYHAPPSATTPLSPSSCSSIFNLFFPSLPFFCANLCYPLHLLLLSSFSLKNYEDSEMFYKFHSGPCECVCVRVNHEKYFFCCLDHRWQNVKAKKNG